MGPLAWERIKVSLYVCANWKGDLNSCVSKHFDSHIRTFGFACNRRSQQTPVVPQLPLTRKLIWKVCVFVCMSQAYVCVCVWANRDLLIETAMRWGSVYSSGMECWKQRFNVVNIFSPDLAKPFLLSKSPISWINSSQQQSGKWSDCTDAKYNSILKGDPSYWHRCMLLRFKKPSPGPDLLFCFQQPPL